MARSRLRRKSSAPARGGLVWIAVVSALGGVFGLWLAPWVVARFEPPAPLDRQQWQLIVPNMQVSFGVLDKRKREGSGLVDGSLYLASHGFGRGDVLVPVVEGEIASGVIELASGSGPVQVSFPTTDVRQGATVSVTTSGWVRRGIEGENPLNDDGQVGFEARGGVLYVNGVQAGAAKAGRVELLASEPAARIRTATFFDAKGEILREGEFSNREVSGRERAWVAAAGVWVALGLAAVVRAATSVAGAAVSVLVAGLPLFLGFAPGYSAWAAVRERLCLTDSVPSEVRGMAMAAGSLWFVLATLAGSGVLQLPTSGKYRTMPLWGCAAVCAAVAVFAAREVGAVWVVAGFAFLMLPIWNLHRAELPLIPSFLRELPTMGIVAALGWERGLIFALAWRVALYFSDVPTFLARNARAGVDTALILVLAAPISIEAALRHTYVQEAWSAETLRGNSLKTTGGKGTSIGAFWESSCGDAPPTANLYFFGGSSTGGAFQFGGHAEWTWPARMHAKLCAVPDRRGTLAAHNFGDSGRDSFDIAGAAPTLFAKQPPSVVLFYGGVNDLMTETSALTRKQSAALVKNQATSSGIADFLSAKSRLFSGLSLLVRVQPASEDAVSAVPIADAEENLRALAAATLASGGTLFLVPEYTSFVLDNKMIPYWEMEKRLAAELTGVELIDLYAIVPRDQREVILADRNHLSREGSDLVAGILAERIAGVVAGEASP